MIRLFQSNDMARLVEAFVARAAAVPADPFEPTTVVVQSFGMGQWLKLQLAAVAGIAANVDSILPATLIWKLYRELLAFDLPDSSPFDTERLTWHLMQLLPECDGDDYTQVRQFLAGSGDSQVRHYQLAQKVATLFDQYLVYRPDWIAGWERADPHAPASWQADLWRRLVNRPQLAGKRHRAQLHRALLARLDALSELPVGVPTHISVFGLSSLPHIHLEALHALSRHIDVDLYFLNPCQHYWGDVISGRDSARRSVKRLLGKTEPLQEEDYLEVGNPLLSSMGKQGREYLEVLLDIDDLETFDAFAPPEGDTMLATVKRDILELTCGGEFGTHVHPTPRSVHDDDISIQVHACHSKMREVEVLHDQLLRIIDQRPDIKPADIIVMTPNVAEYAPFVDAVFNRETFYYSIADRALNQESPVLVALMTLLSLPDMRLTSIEVMDLLEVPTIARKFKLAEDDLLTLAQWISESGIRWELDADSKSVRWQVPAEGHNTWQFGIDRLLLGYAMTASNGAFDGVLPLDIDAGDGELLGKLCHIVELLAMYRALMSEARAADAWQHTVLGLIDDFFEPRGQEELDLGSVRELLVRLVSEIQETGYVEPLSPRMIRFWFDEQLSITTQSRGFISGGVTFATLVPMRSIPFKVVCLLGMNDSDYPRIERPPAFDLMQTEGYRKGDRSKRNDDRYLFLEALLSATDYFYVSYEGRGVKDNKERPPSVLVSEFVDYLTRVFIADPVTQHPLQPFSEDYYSVQRPELVTFRANWFDALTNPVGETRFADARFADDPDLAADNLDKLAQFYRSPARYFLRNRLHVYFEEEDVDLKDTEPFQIDSLERYHLADDALSALLDGQPLEVWRERATESGLVMGGDMGRSQLAREQARASLVYEALQPHITAEPERLHEVIQLDDSRAPLEGIVSRIYGNTIVDCRVGQLRKRQLMEIWVRHLFVNAVRGNTETLCISTHRTGNRAITQRIEAVASNAARDLLNELVQIYNDGLGEPIRFLPEVSFQYVNTWLDTRDDEAAIDAALTEWEWDGPGMEGRDKNYRRLFSFPRDFDERFRNVSLKIYAPLLDRLDKPK